MNKILVVEDNLAAQKVAKLMLSNLNYDVEIASNGKAAIEIVQNKEVDLVLLDLGLPDMSGLNVVKKIKVLKPNLRIVMLTANIHEEDQRELIETGVEKIIVKPLMKEKILEIF
jgi:two-component system aerobic respiration control sensor histidine kinase ArcB